jgi:hypothetical protein
VRGSTPDFKIAGDHRNIGLQYNSEFCLQIGEGIPIHLKVTARHFKLAVDQSLVETKYC